jgi:hypothetical protein
MEKDTEKDASNLTSFSGQHQAEDYHLISMRIPDDSISQFSSENSD